MAARVNLAICSLSLVGGAGICLGYFRSSQQRLRQKMVLGLGVCDVLQALVVLVGTSRFLNGATLADNSPLCNLSGFLCLTRLRNFQTCVVVSAAWTLSVAIVTYITLIHPMSRASELLEHRYATPALWVLVWLSGLIPGAVGTAVFLSVDVGGYCWYKPNSLQSKLMIFVPRAFTLLLVIVIYIRLFIFFRRRDTGLLQTSEETQSEVVGHESWVSRSDTRPPKSTFFLKGLRRPSAPVSIPESTVADMPEVHGESSSATTPLPTPPLIPLDVNRPSRSVFVNLQGVEPKSVDFEGFSNHSEESPDLEASPRPEGPGMKRASVAEHASFIRRQALASTSSAPNPRRLSPRALNRRTSTLMMLYPLAYLLLFSVAVGRLAVSLATNKPVHPVLTDIARWLVFAQGFVDGLIYWVIEALFRRTTRGRT